MSANVVVPLRIISASASREPQRTNSSFTFLASAGKMYLRNQSSSVTSSTNPRSSTIGICVCALISPGMISLLFASMVCLAMIPCGAKLLTSGPTAMIVSPRTAITPFSITCRCGSMVTIVAPVTSRSTETACLVSACANSAPGVQKTDNVTNKLGIKKYLCLKRQLLITVFPDKTFL